MPFAGHAAGGVAVADGGARVGQAPDVAAVAVARYFDRNQADVLDSSSARKQAAVVAVQVGNGMPSAVKNRGGVQTNGRPAVAIVPISIPRVGLAVAVGVKVQVRHQFVAGAAGIGTAHIGDGPGERAGVVRLGGYADAARIPAHGVEPGQAVHLNQAVVILIVVAGHAAGGGRAGRRQHAGAGIVVAGGRGRLGRGSIGDRRALPAAPQRPLRTTARVPLGNDDEPVPLSRFQLDDGGRAVRPAGAGPLAAAAVGLDGIYPVEIGVGGRRPGQRGLPSHLGGHLQVGRATQRGLLRQRGLRSNQQGGHHQGQHPAGQENPPLPDCLPSHRRSSAVTIDVINCGRGRPPSPDDSFRRSRCQFRRLCYNHNAWWSMSSLPNEVRLFFQDGCFRGGILP